MKELTGRSSVLELAFLHHALIRLAVALDTVLERAIAARKLADHLVIACDDDAEWKVAAEPDHLSDVVISGLGTAFSLHLGGSTTGLSGIGASEAISDDDANMGSVGRFGQSFISPSPESNISGGCGSNGWPGRRPRPGWLNREAGRLETNTTMPHIDKPTLRGPGEPRVTDPRQTVSGSLLLFAFIDSPDHAGMSSAHPRCGRPLTRCAVVAPGCTV